MTTDIKIHNDEDFQKMREAGQLASQCLDFITDYIKPGITTEKSIIFSCAVSVLPLLKAQVCHLV